MLNPVSLGWFGLICVCCVLVFVLRFPLLFDISCDFLLGVGFVYFACLVDFVLVGFDYFVCFDFSGLWVHVCGLPLL